MDAPEALIVLLEAQKLMTAAERVTLWTLLQVNYCKHCGSANLPCYCWNDE